MDDSKTAARWVSAWSTSPIDASPACSTGSAWP